MDKGRLQALAELHRAGKKPGVKAAMKAANPPTPPPPKFPIGAPPHMPFSDSASAARFIVEANERRLAGCPPVAPSGLDEASRTAKFIVDTVAKLRARL